MVRIFEQLFDPESSTYTYLIGDADAGVCALVDPVREQIDRDLARVDELGLKLIHTIETHIHADFASGACELAAVTGAELAVSAYDRGELFETSFEHRSLHDGDSIVLGRVRLQALHTPGHTAGSQCFLVDEKLVSGDQANIDDGIALSVDLVGDETGLVGYRGKRHTGLVDVDAPGSCAVLDYWEPIRLRQPKRAVALSRSALTSQWRRPMRPG